MSNLRHLSMFKWFRIVVSVLLIGGLLPAGSATVFAQASFPPANPYNSANLQKSLFNVPKIDNGSVDDKTVEGNYTYAVTPPSIINGDFEQGQYVGWGEYSTHGWSLVLSASYLPGIPPHSGSWATWLGGDYDDTSSIYQNNISFGTSTTLRLWYWIASQDYCGYDYGFVTVNSNTIYTWNLCDANDTGGWNMLDLNLNSYIGQVVTLAITVVTDGNLNSNLFIDDVSLIVAPPIISGNAGAAATTLNYTGGSTSADGSGNYSFTVPYGWSGTVTPTHPCFSFDPPSRPYGNVSVNYTGQNYTATFNEASGCAKIDVTIGGNPMGNYGLASGQELRTNYNVSGGPVVVHSTNAMNLVSAIRLQSYASNTLYSFVETMGVPAGLLSYKYYFPTYNNTWAPLNSQLRFANLDANATTIRVTIGANVVWEQSVAGQSEQRLYFPVSGGPVIVESLDTSKKIVAAIRLQSYASNLLYSFSETLGIPAEQVSDSYYFPTYNNTWAPLNSQLRFGNLESTTTRIRVTIGGVNVWEDDVPGLEERRLTFDVSGGPVKVESLDTSKKIVAAIRLQSYVNNTLYSFVETMGVPQGSLSYKYYFPTYNNTWAPLNSQLRFGNLESTTTRIRVTIGGVNVWEDDVPGLEERRLYFPVSGGPVIIESLDTSKKIVAAIRLQSYANNVLYSFSETLGIPVEQLSDTYYFSTYNNTWAPLNSQLRFGVP